MTDKQTTKPSRAKAQTTKAKADAPAVDFLEFRAERAAKRKEQADTLRAGSAGSMDEKTRLAVRNLETHASADARNASLDADSAQFARDSALSAALANLESNAYARQYAARIAKHAAHGTERDWVFCQAARYVVSALQTSGELSHDSVRQRMTSKDGTPHAGTTQAGYFARVMGACGAASKVKGGAVYDPAHPVIVALAQ